MPTSAAGNKGRVPSACGCVAREHRNPAFFEQRSAGFTLIELLVVIAIIAIAMAGVGLAMRYSGQATLDREAERLAALLESARAQSRASGVAVRWHVTGG